MDYKENVGCDYQRVIDFLEYLNEKAIPVTLRQVIIPTVNDSKENVLKLKELSLRFKSVDKTELLPFRKICQVKYDSMGIPFPFSEIPEPSKETMDCLNSIL